MDFNPVSGDMPSPYDPDNPNPLIPMQAPDLHDIEDIEDETKRITLDNKLNNVQEKLVKNSDQIKNLAASLSTMVNMMEKQRESQMERMDKIMNKLDKRDSSKTRGRSLTKADNVSKSRASSYPDSVKEKDAKWSFFGGNKKEEPSKEVKDMCTSIELRDNDVFSNDNTFMKVNEPLTPAYTDETKINKLYVAMPVTKSRISSHQNPDYQRAHLNETNFESLGARPKDNNNYVQHVETETDYKKKCEDLQRELTDFQNQEREYFKRAQENREQEKEREKERERERMKDQHRFLQQAREREKDIRESEKRKSEILKEKLMREREKKDRESYMIRHIDASPPKNGRGAYGGFSYDEFQNLNDNNENLRFRNLESIETPRFKISNDDYNTKLVHETIKHLQFTVKLSLTKTSLMAYLRQFSILTNQDFMFTEIEYINVINSFVGPEMQEEQGKHHVWLAEYRDDFTGYIGMLRGLKSGFYVTQNDVLNQLNEINTKNMGIFQLFLTVGDIVDSVDNLEWPEKIKNQHYFYYVKRNITPALRQSIDMLLKMDGTKYVYPSKRVLKDFCLRADRNMTMGVVGSKRTGFSVNKVGSAGQPEGKGTSFCNSCKREGYHDEKTCFFHKDREIAHKNQVKYNIESCMMCRSTKHMALNCDKYPNEMPVFKFCGFCLKNGTKAHHKEASCLEKAGN